MSRACFAALAAVVAVAFWPSGAVARAGEQTLVFTAADYQELKNMENVPQILPNTRTFKAVFRIG